VLFEINLREIQRYAKC